MLLRHHEVAVMLQRRTGGTRSLRGHALQPASLGWVSLLVRNRAEALCCSGRAVVPPEQL
eukprot:6656994-Heterocapsa_arctica.AAC.1